MEVYNSWNSDMRVNYFMLKRTPLARYLSADVSHVNSSVLFAWLIFLPLGHPQKLSNLWWIC
jgi:hypothetical protein